MELARLEPATYWVRSNMRIAPSWSPEHMGSLSRAGAHCAIALTRSR